MSEAEQRAAGAAAQGRHAAGTPQSGSRFERGAGYGAAGNGYGSQGASSGYGSQGAGDGYAGSGDAGYGAGQDYGNAGGYAADNGYGSQGAGRSHAGNGYGGAGGYGANSYGSPANRPPRTVSRSEANDVARYRQMRQAKDESPLQRAARRGRQAIPGAEARQARRSGYGTEVQGMGRPSFDARRAAKYAKRGLLGLVALLVAFSVIITVRMNAGISLETRAALSAALPGQPFYMLLVGTDKDEYREENNSTDGIYRTDSIILARVDPIAAKLTLVSIQRDTLVDLGGDYGEQKINAAYAIGGAPMLIKAVSNLAGVSIAHYAEIDLDQFISVVDAIGGITVNVPVDCYDPDYTGADIKAGVQTLDGDNALKLCRARHAYDQYGAGDYYRTANQRMVLGAILKKSLSGNPLMLFACMNTGSASVTTDLTGFDLMFLGLRFIGFNMSEDLYSALEPTVSSYENSTWYERVNEEAWSKMMGRVDQGLPPYESEAEDPTAGIAAGVA